MQRADIIIVIGPILLTSFYRIPSGIVVAKSRRLSPFINTQNLYRHRVRSPLLHQSSDGLLCAKGNGVRTRTLINFNHLSFTLVLRECLCSSWAMRAELGACGR